VTDDERFLELWADYLEGELDEVGIAELRGLLRAGEGRLDVAADTYQTHRLLGVLADELHPGRDDFIRQTLARLPADGDRFTRGVMRTLGRRPGSGPASGVPLPTGRVLWISRPWLAGAAAAAMIVLTLLALGRRTHDRPASRHVLEPAGAARLANSAGARFFGELSPAVRSTLASRRDYVLMSGLVELAFPAGASAIIEGPAVFRVLSGDGLSLEAGRCSVHAPPGAEGFRVETPVTRVIDRGTRFTVSVAETSETEVQVIEGAADVRGRSEGPAGPIVRRGEPGQPGWEIRLKGQESRRFWGPGAEDTAPARFTPSVYRRGLPDRVVSFAATSDGDGGAEEITSVTIQRGGELVHYTAGQLIPIDLTWFRSTGVVNPHGHLAAGAVLPSRRGDVLSDMALNTGVINPGGSVRPLESDPVMAAAEDPKRPGTPGLAVRFRTPVVNRPGPDVVFFELQTALNPPDGDAFHVSPLEFRAGRRSFTVRTFDLTMTSPEALKLAPFFLYRFPAPVVSLVGMETEECVRLPKKSSFHALAVGIDLSNLGFRDGERVDGLFFQDAQDDDHQVDPVLIAGLPDTRHGESELPNARERPLGPPRAQVSEAGTVPGGS
jgi:hypothetical protein